MFGATVYATDVTTPIDEEITVMNLYTDRISTSVAKSTGTTLKYACTVCGKSSSTKISVYLYLQEYNNGVWKNVSVATKEVNAKYLSLTGSYSSAITGRKYRTEAHVYTYSGSKYEYLEVHSSALTK